MPGNPVIGPESSRYRGRIVAHIEHHVGPVASVLSEYQSQYVHLDIACVPPSPDRDFHTLVTCGMSDRAMTVPEGMERAALAELYLCLPPDWPISNEAFRDEKAYWPVRLLRSLARMPHETESYVSVTHTISHGAPPEPYAENTALCAAFLNGPILLPKDFRSLELEEDAGARINFYSVIPLHAGELEFKVREGSQELMGCFEQAGDVSELLDPGRKSAVRKQRMRWLQ